MQNLKKKGGNFSYFSVLAVPFFRESSTATVKKKKPCFALLETTSGRVWPVGTILVTAIGDDSRVVCGW